MDATEFYIYNHHPPLEALWLLRHITGSPVFLIIFFYFLCRTLFSCPVYSNVPRILLSVIFFHTRYLD